MKKYFEILKELRIDKDLKQKEIASILKTTQSYYAQYENGKRSLPIEHLVTLCKFYNISADYILRLPDLPYPQRLKENENEKRICKSI